LPHRRTSRTGSRREEMQSCHSPTAAVFRALTEMSSRLTPGAGRCSWLPPATTPHSPSRPGASDQPNPGTRR